MAEAKADLALLSGPHFFERYRFGPCMKQEPSRFFLFFTFQSQNDPCVAIPVLFTVVVILHTTAPSGSVMHVSLAHSRKSSAFFSSIFGPICLQTPHTKKLVNASMCHLFPPKNCLLSNLTFRYITVGYYFFASKVQGQGGGEVIFGAQ